MRQWKKQEEICKGKLGAKGERNPLCSRCITCYLCERGELIIVKITERGPYIPLRKVCNYTMSEELKQMVTPFNERNTIVRDINTSWNGVAENKFIFYVWVPETGSWVDVNLVAPTDLARSRYIEDDAKTRKEERIQFWLKNHPDVNYEDPDETEAEIPTLEPGMEIRESAEFCQPVGGGKVGRKSDRRAEIQCREEECSRANCVFMHKEGQQVPWQSKIECRSKLCKNKKCAYKHTTGQKSGTA